MDLLRAQGITTIFGNPGSTELPMFRDFPDDFRYVLGLQESVAVGMADGYAQATGGAALVNLHSAAGLGHGLGNVFTAFRNRTPLVLVAGQQARSLLTGEPFLYAERAPEFAEPYVKFAREPARAADVPATIARAIHVALAPPRGPVLVSVPVDDWDAPVDPATPLLPHAVHAKTRGDPDALADVARRLAPAARPVFVVGAEVDRDGAFHDVVALAERHRAAVWVAPLSSRCSFPESHPLFAGFLPASREGIVAALDGHDLVVVLGSPVFPYHVEGAGPLLPAGAELIQLTEDADQAAWTPTGTSVVTGLRHGVRDLLAGPEPVARPTPPGRERAARVAADGASISEALLLQTLADLRPPDSVIVEEAPDTRGPMHDHLPIDRPRRVPHLRQRRARATGCRPPSGWRSRAGSDQRIIALVGDGSSMYGIQALWSAAQLGVDLTVVVVHNARYAALDSFAAHFAIDEPVGTTLPGLDFVALAAGQGVPGVRVTRPDELAPALARALASRGPSLVDVIVDRP